MAAKSRVELGGGCDHAGDQPHRPAGLLQRRQGLLGSSRSSYDVRRCMDEGKIVLACPAGTGDKDRLLAKFLVYDVLQGALSRKETPPDRRRPFYVFFDEVQTYDGASRGNLAALLEQAAKYGVRAFVANQNPERLTPATFDAVTTNRSHLATTAVNARAAAMLSREYGGAVSPATIGALPRYTYLTSVTLGREVSPRLACWYATERGAEVIEAVDARPGGRRVLVTPDRADGMLQSHTLAVNDVGIAFATWAARHGHECGALAWEHEVAHRISDRRPGAGADLLVADALLHDALADRGRIALVYRFVELDRATMAPQEVGDKLRRYVRYGRYVPKDSPRGRPAWQERYPGLPGVLVVLTGKPRPRLEARRDMLVALCRLDPVIRDADATTISICLLTDLQEHGPFSPIFTRPGDDAPVDLLGRTAASCPADADRGAA